MNIITDLRPNLTISGIPPGPSENPVPKPAPELPETPPHPAPPVENPEQPRPAPADPRPSGS